MASSGSFSFGCSAAGPLLPPSFSFPSQPAASSFPFTNDPAPTPCRHAPVHPATSPSEDSQAPGSPLCCPALLPEKLFPRPLCLLGLPLCGPALLPEKLFPRPLCLLGLPLCGPVLPLRVPFPWPLMPFLQPPAFPRISLPRPIPLFAHLPAALRAARPVWSRSLLVRATFLPQPSPWVFSQ